jgi:hypothetical protein
LEQIIPTVKGKDPMYIGSNPAFGEPLHPLELITAPGQYWMLKLDHSAFCHPSTIIDLFAEFDALQRDASARQIMSVPELAILLRLQIALENSYSAIEVTQSDVRNVVLLLWVAGESGIWRSEN